MADVILRSEATKNLVHCKKNRSERRMRSFAPLSMKFRGGQPVQKDGGVIGRAVGAREWDSRASVKLFEHLIDNGMEPPFQDSDI